MRLGEPGFRAMALAVASLAFLCLAAHGAQARAEHHQRVHGPTLRPAIAQPAPDSGFGPTAPGMSSILIDAGSGAVLSATGADIPRYPASLTKLMTLDLAFQALAQGRMTLDTELPVSGHAAGVEPVKLGLAPGRAIPVRDAILAMTTMSANDAATALGEYLGGGSEARCGQMMTLRAHALGMAQTEFYNASGLPNPNQVTTARDLSILARDIVENYPQFQSFFEVQKFNFGGRMVYSNNAMLKIYPGATGMKTGYTILARHNLITSATRNGKILIGVVLHEPSWGETYRQMTAMLDGGFGTHEDGPNMMLASVAATTAAAAGPAPAALPVDQVENRRRAVKTAQPIQLAGNRGDGRDGRDGGFSDSSWTAQFGVYKFMSKARVAAISVQHMRGVGIPRIARLERHGKVLWSAQLAGLTQTAAHKTCDALVARRAACVIIAPQSDHLAMRDLSDG